jgi:shikimate kinase
MTTKPLIFLIGYRGSGKTTVAKLLSERLAWSWCDADAVLEERFGRSIRQIFADEGEESFRDKETEVLKDLCHSKNVVVATGGGVILRPENRELLRIGLVVWLTADAETLHHRIQADATTQERRPNLAHGGLEEVKSIWAKREPIYSACADLKADTTRLTPEAIVSEIISAL